MTEAKKQGSLKEALSIGILRFQLFLLTARYALVALCCYLSDGRSSLVVPPWHYTSFLTIIISNLNVKCQILSLSCNLKRIHLSKKTPKKQTTVSSSPTTAFYTSVQTTLNSVPITPNKYHKSSSAQSTNIKNIYYAYRKPITPRFSNSIPCRTC